MSTTVVAALLHWFSKERPVMVSECDSHAIRLLQAAAAKYTTRE